MKLPPLKAQITSPEQKKSFTDNINITRTKYLKIAMKPKISGYFYMIIIIILLRER